MNDLYLQIYLTCLFISARREPPGRHSHNISIFMCVTLYFNVYIWHKITKKILSLCVCNFHQRKNAIHIHSFVWLNSFCVWLSSFSSTNDIRNYYVCDFQNCISHFKYNSVICWMSVFLMKFFKIAKSSVQWDRELFCEDENFLFNRTIGIIIKRCLFCWKCFTNDFQRFR